MKIILLSVLTAIVIGVLASFILGEAQRPAYEAFSTPNTRVTPGDNLVGENWSGNPHPDNS
jgi:hypothetical protein